MFFLKLITSKNICLFQVDHIKTIIPNISLTSDLICGFCSETEEEFPETLSLMEYVNYEFCYIYAYRLVLFIFKSKNIVQLLF